ncbi:hypothetical protein SKAU_G00030130 [Synaphobranchus kaupii]|uniref:NELL2-interacting cell ontogeny regulator 1 n=1 Tax=Synaphobranchus kaupii TaxID=118154 RepID=A0A9Q1GDL2_SYNKA|nr:hypothetical protein SKAU_G00030130 [Synaphobranchus kaupii]
MILMQSCTSAALVNAGETNRTTVALVWIGQQKAGVGGDQRCFVLIKTFVLTGDRMRAKGFLQSMLTAAVMMLLMVELLCLGPLMPTKSRGTVIPAESRPCVDCHAFEFMQRALQDLKKTAFNPRTRGPRAWLLRAEKRALCDCMPANALS